MTSSERDLLALKLLNLTHLTYEAVRGAVPPLLHTGTRTFVGSRGAAVDTSLNDQGEDGTGYGFPSFAKYVMNLSALHAGEPAILDPQRHINASYIADGLVGGHLPIVRFSITVSTDSPFLPPNATGVRHWELVAAAVPDMNGSREQDVWFRFQQLHCAEGRPCALLGRPLYFSTYWWSNSPDGRVGATGPEHAASASGFYGNLRAVREWWAAELAAEGMMALELPSPAATNGSLLSMQAMASIIRAMITRKGKWHPRYGVNPGCARPLPT